MDRVPVTPEGLAKLKAELQALEKKEPVIQKAIATAREKGDLRENAEYHAAREELAMVGAKISELRDRIARAVIVEIDDSSKDTVRFTAKVTVRDIERDTEEVYELVGAGEEDIFENKILTSSPMGQALLGKKVGETVHVKTPGGEDAYEILDISYE